MTSRDNICRVRALYPYESSDPSSLSFKSDAIIEVLAKLDSGWWDGWCDGKRGWFPSNYVEVISDDIAEHQSEQDLQQWRYQQQIEQQQMQIHQLQQQQQQIHQQRGIRQRELRLSMHGSEVFQNNTTSSSPWILQITEDGSEQYYYNVQTQEMRYSMPPDFYSEEQVQDQPNFFHTNSHDFERPPTRPVRAANRVITDYDVRRNQNFVETQQLPSRAASTVPPSIFAKEDEFEDDDQLPPNWIRKMTPRGRYYYCNIKTEETTWNLEDIDPDTGILTTSLSVPESPKNSVFSYNDSATVLNEDHSIDESPLTWQSLSSLIAQAILSLKDSVRQGKSVQFGDDTTLIVHRIRLLLYVTNCLDKETSTHLKLSKQLRALHRSLLAAIAKLVLATKVASSAWPTPESLIKLQSDADECLIAVRNFMSHAQELNIEFKDNKPTLTADNNLWHYNPLIMKSNSLGLMLGKSDTQTAILLLADNMQAAMSSYHDSVREAYVPFENQDIHGTLTKLKANAPLLVAQFRNLSNTTSHFLNAIEEICQTQPNDPRSPILAKSRKPIYAAMGTLFIVSQTITRPDMDAEQLIAANNDLIECRNGIESGIQQVMDASQMHVDEPSPTDPPRETPTPTQRRLFSDSNDVTNEIPITPAATSTTFTSDFEDTHGSEELANNIRSMGLNHLQSELSFDDASSYHSEMTATQQARKDSKITKFFGEDTIAAARQRDTLLGAPSNASVVSLNQVGSSSASITGTDQLWFLGSDVDPHEMVINLEGNVKGGTLHGLVVYLTQHDQLDSKFNNTFLLTYRSFCTTQELFNELFNRYQTPPPEDLKPDELELWREKKLKLIRLRVFNVIKSWLETYFNEEEDRNILPEINHFTDNVIVESMKFGAEQLSKLIKKRMLAEDSEIRKMKLNVRTADMPVPILPKNMKRIKLLELDPHELARQMTIMDFRLYNRIKPVECLDKNWGKTEVDEQGHHIAANVKASIEHSNQVTAWVTDSILSKEEVKKRAGVLKHWILVAERCRLLNNYNTCMAILSAFDNGSIGRLKRTWELISARAMQILQNIRRLMGANRNFSEYRELIHKVNPPCIPFLGIYLQDLTFIEDGNSNFLKKSVNHINFAKRMKTAEVIRDLQQYQSTHYMLTAVPDIQEFIKTHLQSSREEEELYNLSLKLEPRERGEDTIARRLKESGL